MKRGLLAHPVDNVATLVHEGTRGDRVIVEAKEKEKEVVLLTDVPCFHKFALNPIEAGEEIVKYGESIGRATAAIKIGEYVHIHNVESQRGRGDIIGGLK